MNENEIEQARRWVRLEGFDWSPGMVACQTTIDDEWRSLRVLHVERLGYPDAEMMDSLSGLINDGALGWRPADGATIKVTPSGKPGSAHGFVGVVLPIGRDEYGDLDPAIIQLSGSVQRFFPDLDDEATRWCLIGIASGILEDKGISTENIDCATLLNLLEECEQAEAGRADESPWHRGVGD